MDRSSAARPNGDSDRNALPQLRTGPWMSSHIARWCAAQQNWDKIHYDLAYATRVAGLPGTVINGALKQHLIVRFLEAALPGAWVWRLDYRFSGMDIVGQSLEVYGESTETRVIDGRTFVRVDFRIQNVEQGADTTTGTAVCILDAGRDPALFVDRDLHAPQQWLLDVSVRDRDLDMPSHVNSKLGERLESVESDYAIDFSRLRLFAEAIGEQRPLYFAPGFESAGKIGDVLAPPLFPLHALEFLPGSRPLSTDPAAIGREGVSEVGRHMAGHFGFEIGWNGGNSVQVHSLARVGERVAAESVLVGAYSRVGRFAGRMLFFETLNRYRTSDGRPLLTERQVMICRSTGDKGGE